MIFTSNVTNKKATLDLPAHWSQQPGRTTGTQLQFGQLNAQVVHRIPSTTWSKSEVMDMQKIILVSGGKGPGMETVALTHSPVCELIRHRQAAGVKTRLLKEEKEDCLLYSFRQETGGGNKMS